MLSFITAARDYDETVALQQNLEAVFHKSQSIETEFLPQIGCSSIATAYNQGARAAKFDALCFLHTDVSLLCHSGVFEKPLALLKKPAQGLIGAAGSVSLGTYGCWWKVPNEECRGLVHHPDKSEPFGIHGNCWPHVQSVYSRVLICDGVFLMISRRSFDRLGGFDENYPGFHYYDLVLSMKSHIAGLVNTVAPVPLLHQSVGQPGGTWEENRRKFVSEFGRYLPCRIEG